MSFGGRLAGEDPRSRGDRCAEQQQSPEQAKRHQSRAPHDRPPLVAPEPTAEPARYAEPQPASFDHYFGCYAGVRGFGDRHQRSVFHQRRSTGGEVRPFRFATNCMADLTHDWGPQHQSWNGGRMNQFVAAHQAAGDPGPEETMGNYNGADLPLYYALADRFTICDGYHCSVIGPTDPNRLMSMSAWIAATQASAPGFVAAAGAGGDRAPRVLESARR